MTAITESAVAEQCPQLLALVLGKLLVTPAQPADVRGRAVSQRPAEACAQGLTDSFVARGGARREIPHQRGPHTGARTYPALGVSLYERDTFFVGSAPESVRASPGGNMNLRDPAKLPWPEGEEWRQVQRDRLQVEADRRQAAHDRTLRDCQGKGAAEVRPLLEHDWRV